MDLTSFQHQLCFRMHFRGIKNISKVIQLVRNRSIKNDTKIFTFVFFGGLALAFAHRTIVNLKKPYLIGALECEIIGH